MSKKRNKQGGAVAAQETTGAGVSPADQTVATATLAPTDPAVDTERQAFVDLTAIALFARGWPDKNVYTQAEKLWALRGAHLAAEARKFQAKSLVSPQESPADDADSNNEVQ